jgi:hypothetical protein
VLADQKLSHKYVRLVFGVLWVMKTT